MNKIKKLADLIERINQGDSIEYLFFMGHRQKKGSAVSEACLSGGLKTLVGTNT